MKPYIMLVGLLMVAMPSAALADRTWELEGKGTGRMTGFPSVKLAATGTLTLFGDPEDPAEGRSYSLTLQIDGEAPEVSTGVWLQEGNRIQILQESPAASEAIAELEDLLSDLLNRTVVLTSIQEKGSIKINSRTQELRMSVSGTLLARPGLRGNKPLKLTEKLKLRGRLASP